MEKSHFCSSLRKKNGLVMKDKFKTLAVTGQLSIQMKGAYKLLSAMLIFPVRDFLNLFSLRECLESRRLKGKYIHIMTRNLDL